jgi:hypothetical protein
MTPALQRTATKIKKSEFVGKGALVQAIGIVVSFLFLPFSLVPGIILLIVGGRMAIVRKCSECCGKVEIEARVCQHCGAHFGE